MKGMSNNRAFLILRYTLIVATAYLLVVEGSFSAPPVSVVLLVSAALLSNVIIAQLPTRIIQSSLFALGTVVCDTLWITALLLQSGRFNAEFFYLYFFVLLLAAIGENLHLIVIGTVVVCVAYVYLLMASGGSWSLWNSPSLIRLPFLFTAASFYGYLVDRTRSERRRADKREEERNRAQEALRDRTLQLQEEAQISGALVQVGREMISSLDTPVMLERLCEVTTEVLECDCSHTFLWRAEEEAYVAISGYGDSQEQWETMRVLKYPRSALARFLTRLETQDVIQIRAASPEPRPAILEYGAHTSLYIPLRRGSEIIGIHTAGYRDPGRRFTRQQQRIAGGIGQTASMALANARLVEELERANRVKSNFVASMSHELRTPLNLIIGYNDLMREGTFGPLTAEQCETIGRVQKSSRELLEMIEATLDLSRLEAQQVKAEPGEISVRDLVAELDADTRVLRDKPDVEFLWRIDASLPSLRTDPLKLKMILKNLIVNAVKFTDRGSITVSACARAEGIEFTVADTGIGIPAEAHEVVFEPFRQAGGVPHHRGGAGLGLYIVRRLLDLLGGTISLESDVGRGSAFHVWIASASEADGARPVTALCPSAA